MRQRLGNIHFVLATSVVAFSALALAGCFRGLPSDKPPVHVNPNMDTQEKVKPYAKSEFYDNGASMRQPVGGTIARGDLKQDSLFFFGKDSRGKLAENNPFPITMELLQRGQERYDIFCAPCHGRVGDGRGPVVLRGKGMIPPPNFHDQRLIDTADGHFVDVITNGVRNMPTYKHQVSIEDRWAITAYIRALQRSQNARLNDIPADKRNQIR